MLIVDDDHLCREALTRLLSLLGFETCSVATVAKGVAKLDGQQCAIIDLNLPDGLGTYILERIQSEHRAMRVAVCTGTSDDALVATARAFGAEIVLRKPLNVSALIHWLNKAS